MSTEEQTNSDSDENSAATNEAFSDEISPETEQSEPETETEPEPDVNTVNDEPEQVTEEDLKDTYEGADGENGPIAHEDEDVEELADDPTKEDEVEDTHSERVYQEDDSFFNPETIDYRTLGTYSVFGTLASVAVVLLFITAASFAIAIQSGVTSLTVTMLSLAGAFVVLAAAMAGFSFILGTADDFFANR